MRIAVVGTRTFENYTYLKSVLDAVIRPDDVIITGDAPGTDALAVKWAKERGREYVSHAAEWERYGDAAGPIRNAKVVADAEVMIAFWDGRSRGTIDAIGQAVQRGLRVRIYPISPGDKGRRKRRRDHDRRTATLR